MFEALAIQHACVVLYCHLWPVRLYDIFTHYLTNAKIFWEKKFEHKMCFRSVSTGCPRRNVPDFGRVFLMLKYTDITQNTYIQSWTVTDIMAREKWGLLAVPNTATCTADTSRDSANVLDSGSSVHCACVTLWQSAMLCYRRVFSCIVLVTLRITMTWLRVFL